MPDEPIARGSQLLSRAPAAVGLVIVILAVTVLVSRPAGEEDAAAAARAPFAGRARAQTLRVLIVRRWGEGALTLTRFDDRAGRRRIVFGFAIDRGRGWRMVASTERTADVTDVTVGSLLVTTSAGGTGQPAWSAIYGELGEARIAKVEVLWDAGPPTTAERSKDAYLAVRDGIHKPTIARYLGPEGAEIAKVPIS